MQRNGLLDIQEFAALKPGDTFWTSRETQPFGTKEGFQVTVKSVGTCCHRCPDTVTAIDSAGQERCFHWDRSVCYGKGAHTYYGEWLYPMYISQAAAEKRLP